jgi:hypothetical protein
VGRLALSLVLMVLAATAAQTKQRSEYQWDLIAFLESLTDREALADTRWSDPWESR